MKVLSFQSLIVNSGLFILLLLSSNSSAQECGTDRWSVKTIRDKGAGQISWKAVPSSVSEQCSIPRTLTAWESLPRQADELQLYQIPCILVGLGKEKDNDFHLIVKDPKTGQTMVAEIPDPACKESSTTKLAPKYAIARDALRKVYGEPSGIKPVKPMKLILWGVGFWEEKNHGEGHSKNGREIHPVVGIN